MIKSFLQITKKLKNYKVNSSKKKIVSFFSTLPTEQSPAGSFGSVRSRGEIETFPKDGPWGKKIEVKNKIRNEDRVKEINWVRNKAKNIKNKIKNQIRKQEINKNLKNKITHYLNQKKNQIINRNIIKITNKLLTKNYKIMKQILTQLNKNLKNVFSHLLRVKKDIIMKFGNFHQGMTLVEMLGKIKLSTRPGLVGYRFKFKLRKISLRKFTRFVLVFRKIKMVQVVGVFLIFSFFYSPGLAIAADTSAPTVTAPISTAQRLKSGAISTSNVNINETGTVYMQRVDTGGLTTLPTADNLTGLIINDVGTISGYNFSAGTKEYYNVYSSATSVTVTPTGAGVITVNGTVVSSGSASASVNLTSGTQTISVVVSQTGKMDNVYTLKVMNVATSTSGTVIDSVPGYKIHKFTSSGSFVAPAAISGAETLVVGGGGSGGMYSGKAGNGGIVTISSSQNIPSGSTPVTIGAGGYWTPWPYTSYHGTSSSFNGITSGGGATGESNYGASANGTPIPGTTSAITGSSVVYGQGGLDNDSGANGAANTGNGGNTEANTCGSTPGTMCRGGSGIVVIKYPVPSQTPTLAKPTFSPNYAVGSSSVTTTIAGPSGATIYYTTDGTTPTISSSVYSTPIVTNAASVGKTIKAIAVKSGSDNSAVATITYIDDWATQITAKNAFVARASAAAGTSTVTVPAVNLVNDGTYNIIGVDTAGNTSATLGGWLTIDNTAPIISSTAPATSAFINSATVSYTLNEAAATGSVTFTRTGGTVDASSPRVCSLRGGALTSGAHSNLLLTNGVDSCTGNFSLQSGSIYSIAFNFSDAAGNAATTITKTGVTVDTTSPTVTVEYSANPAPMGPVVITATFSEALSSVPNISIHQPGSADILDSAMTLVGGNVYSYSYTINRANGSSYVDGIATVTFSNVLDLAGNTLSGNILATGGTISYVDSNSLNPRSSGPYSGGYTIHSFTSNGSFNAVNSGTTEALVVAGGGGGNIDPFNSGYYAGGGAGGLIYNSSYLASSGVNAISVGLGGVNNAAQGVPAGSGGNSIFGSLVSIGGGGALRAGGYGSSGGSGGGYGGAGTPGQGNNGGSQWFSGCGNSYGGGGAGSVGLCGSGGSGLSYNISGTNVTYARGGGNIGSTIANTGNGGDWTRSGSSGIVVLKYLSPSFFSIDTVPPTITSVGSSVTKKGGDSSISTVSINKTGDIYIVKVGTPATTTAELATAVTEKNAYKFVDRSSMTPGIQYPVNPVPSSGVVNDGVYNFVAVSLAGNVSDPYDIWQLTVDNTGPVISSTAPATGALVNSATVGYSLNEASSAGSGSKITFTRTGGTSDASSPHVCLLNQSLLSQGSHTGILLDATNCTNGAISLVSDAVYSVSFDFMDLVGNPATTVTNTGVTVDMTPPTATLTFSPNPAPVGSMTTTVTFSEPISGTPTINIDQQGTTDIVSGEITSSVDIIGTYNAGTNPTAIDVDSPNNSIWIVNNSTSNNVRKINASTGALIGTYNAGTDSFGIAVDSVNNAVWVTNLTSSGTVRKINASTGALIGTYNVGSNPRGVAVDPTSNAIWVVNYGSNTVTKLNASTGALIGTYAVGGSPTVVAVDPTSNAIWVANSGSNTVTKLNASTGVLIGTYAVGNQPWGLAVDSTNNAIWVANTFSSNVTKLNASTGALIGTYTVGSNPIGIAFDSTNNAIWTKQYILNASTGAPISSHGFGDRGIVVDSIGNFAWFTDYISSNVTKLSHTHTYTYTVNTQNSPTYLDGIATVTVDATDLAGNALVVQPIDNTFEIDTVPPTITSVGNSVTKKAGDSSGSTVSINKNGDIYILKSGTIATTTAQLATAVTAGNAYKFKDRSVLTPGEQYEVLLPESSLTNDGVYNFVAVSLAGNVSAPYDGWQLTVDNTAPTIVVTSNATSSGILKIGDTITFTITPTTTELDAVVNSVSYNGQALIWSTANSGATYTSTYTVVSGQTDRTSALQLTGVTLTDSVGNTSSLVSSTDVVKTIDANAPTNQDAVFEGSTFKKGGAIVAINSSGNITNNVWFAPLGTISFVEGAMMTKATNGNAVEILSPAGDNAYRLFVIDAAGNYSAPSSAILTVDATKPLATAPISNPQVLKSGTTSTSTVRSNEDGKIYLIKNGTTVVNQNEIDLAIIAKNAFLGVVDAQATIPRFVTVPVDASSISDGLYNIVAVDTVGNVSDPASGWLTVDNTLPTSSIDVPTNNSLVTTMSSIEGAASDTNGINSVRISIKDVNGNKYFSNISGTFSSDTEVFLDATGTTTWSYAISNSVWTSNIPYLIKSYATDVAQNTEVTGASSTFTIDKISPTVAITYTTNPAKAGINTITATYSEPVESAPTITVNQQGSLDPSATMTLLSPGVYTYDYEVGTHNNSTRIDGIATVSLSAVQDPAGNIAEAPTNNTFVIDTRAPTSGIQDICSTLGNECTTIGEASSPQQSYKVHSLAGATSDVGTGSGVVEVHISILNTNNNRYYNPEEVAADKFSSVTEIYTNGILNEDNISWSFDTSSIIFSLDNVYEIHSKAIDDAGNSQTNITPAYFTFTNSPPVVSNVTALENADGTVTIGYSTSDAESSNTTNHLFYSIGQTLSNTLTNTTTTITLSDATFLPNSGSILIDDEIISYTSKTGNSLSGVTRGSGIGGSSTAYSHNAGTIIYVYAPTTTGDKGIVATGTGKVITWTAKTDADGYQNINQIIKVVANDGSGASMIGSGTSPAFIFDQAEPTGTVSSLLINTLDGQSGPVESESNEITLSLQNITGHPANENIFVQFSSDGTNWYGANANGTLGIIGSMGTGFASDATTLGALSWPWTMTGRTATIQVKITDSYSNTSVVDDNSVSYNARPEFDTTFGTDGLSVSQILDRIDPNFAKLKIDYRIRDTDNSTVTPTFSYDIGAGFVTIDNASIEGLVTNTVGSTYTTYTVYWTPTAGIETTNASFKVMIDDLEVSTNTAEKTISNLIIDKKNPVISTPVTFDAGVAGVTDSGLVTIPLPADVSAIQYRILDDSATNSIVVDTGWIDMSALVSIPWTFDIDVEAKTLKYQYRDAYGNTTDLTTLTTLAPISGSSFLVQDASNPNIPTYDMYIGWGSVPPETVGFASYKLEFATSTDNSIYGSYTSVGSGMNNTTTNYYLHRGLNSSLYYKYRLGVTGTDGNTSIRAGSPVTAKPDGIQNFGEGGGGGGVATASQVENVVPSQNSTTKDVTITYRLTDGSFSKKINPSYEANVFYNIGITLPASAFQGGNLTVSDASKLKSSGYVQINNEVIAYSGKTGNTLTGLTRGTWPTALRATRQNPIFFQGTPVWVMASTVAPTSITNTTISTGQDGSIVWSLYDESALAGSSYNNVGIRVLVHDNQDAGSGPLSSQSDYSEIGTLDTLNLTAPTITFDSPTSSGDESVSPVEFGLTLSRAYPINSTVNYVVTGTATGGGVDYTLADGTITITAGETTINATALIIDDLLNEVDETIEITLSSPVGAILGANTTHVYTIIDNDNDPEIQFTTTSSSGDEDVTEVLVEVSTLTTSGSNITVNYTVTGTATGGGVDYTLADGVATITAGQNSTNISLVIVDDNLYEASENVVITLSTPSGAILGTNTIYTYTIIDNDTVPVISFNTPKSSNGSESVATVNIPISLSASSYQDVVVNYSATAGTTASVSDYSLGTGTTTISAGSTTGNIVLSINENSIQDGDRVVEITLTSGNANATASLVNNVYTYTINDNDNAVASFATAQSSFGDEDNAGVQIIVPITVTLSSSSNSITTINYTVGGTATSGTDYTALSGSLTIPAEALTGDINISLTPDTLDEDDETIVITLTSATGAQISETNKVYTYTIVDNDVASEVGFATATGERLENVTPLTYNIPVTAVVSGKSITVDYVIETTGTAILDDDFTATNTTGTLTIPAGSTTANIPIRIINDNIPEADETIIVTLSNSSNATLGVSSYTYTILNDDQTSVGFVGSSGQGNENEISTPKITISLTAISAQNVDVPYTVTGTATNAVDYNITAPVSGVLTIPAGSISADINLTIVGDTTIEADETIIFEIGDSVVNATKGTPFVYTYTIKNDDNAIASFAVAQSSGGIEDTIGSVPVTVSIDALSSVDTTINYAIGGTATSGTDYTALSGSVVILANNLTAEILISVTPDTLSEENETIILTLTTATGATISPTNKEYTFTINDDDVDSVVGFSDTTNTVTRLENATPLAYDIPVTLNTVSGKIVTVNYSVKSIGTTATSNSDYVLAPGTLTFSPGNLEKNITLNIINDLLKEADETIVIELSSPSNATLGATTEFTYTIEDDEPDASIEFVSSASQGSENLSANIALVLDAPSTEEITVTYSVSGTATNIEDYTITPSPLVVPINTTSVNIPITIVDDSIIEPNETIIITLLVPTNAALGTKKVHTYTIINNDTDTTPPVIVLNSPELNPMPIIVGEGFTDPGATATDNVDDTGTLTARIIASSTVDSNTEGDYTVTYNVTDSAGNMATPVIRNVEVRYAPTYTITASITGDENGTISDPGVSVVPSKTDKTYTITPNTGYKVNTITIGSVGVVLPTLGVNTYTFTNLRRNDSINVTFTLSADETPPVIALDGLTEMYIVRDSVSTFVDPGFTITDDVDGDPTTHACTLGDTTVTPTSPNCVYSITGSVNTTVKGDYTLTYNAVDSSKNRAIPVSRIVHVTYAPTYRITVTAGANGEVSPSTGDYASGVKHTFTITPDTDYKIGSITVDGIQKLPTTPTTYQTENLTDDTVIVVNFILTNAAAPTIVIIGDNPMTIASGNAYVEQGATATDSLGTDITSDIEISGNVDTSKGGVYEITYSVIDAAGVAAIAKRTVTVTDTAPPIISEISVPVITTTAAAITWTTNEPSTSQVIWGTETGALTNTTTKDNTLSIYHVVTLTGLAENTPYFFKVISEDSSANSATSDPESTFTTIPTVTSVVVINNNTTNNPLNENVSMFIPDVTAPIITDFKIYDISAFEAKVSFTTDEETLSFAEYGRTNKHGENSANNRWSTEHVINLRGLKFGTDYHVKVTAVDRAGNSSSTESKIFKTKFFSENPDDLTKIENVEQFQAEIESTIESILPALIPPFIEEPKVIDISENSATITYRTNIKAYPVVGYIEESAYDKTKANPYLIETSDTTAKSFDHTLKLLNLRPNMLYHLQARAFSLPQVVGKSAEITFTTKASKIKGSIIQRKKDSFVVTWTTDEATSSIVEYKNVKTGEVSRIIDSINRDTNHLVRVENLTPGTTYEVKISGINARGNLVEGAAALRATTLVDVTPPVITSFKVESSLVTGRTDRAQSIVSWKTDEPSTSIVYYEEGSGSPDKALANKQQDTSTLVTNHVVILSTLKPGTIYRFQIASVDDAGNRAVLPIRTIITPRQNESIVDVIFKNFDETFNFLKNVR